MKLTFYQYPYYPHGDADEMSVLRWYWRLEGQHCRTDSDPYTRLSDAVRGYRRYRYRSCVKTGIYWHNTGEVITAEGKRRTVRI